MSVLKYFTLDISPLRKNRDYRLLFFGQLVSVLGTMITHVAIQYQIYQRTNSTAAVGLLGVIQLLPLSISGFIGGAVADKYDRKKIIVIAESLLALSSAGLFVTAIVPSTPVYTLYFIAAFASFLGGFHQPALSALTPRIIEPDEIPAVSALSGLRGTTGMIVGPSLAGIILASLGLEWTYGIDAASFGVSITSVLFIRKKFQAERTHAAQSTIAQIKEGMHYAWKRPVLIGTYCVDIVSMMCAFPFPLFPAIAQQYGGARAMGMLFSASAVGSFIASISSGWIADVKRHGRTIALAAIGWCVGIALAGISNQLWLVLFFLALAGFSDMISAMFRQIVWNQTIPDTVRGRMAGVEMLSYLSGPMLGGTLIGFAAEGVGTSTAMIAGGVIGVAGILSLLFWLKPFWQYAAERH